MNHQDHVALIKDGVQGQVWADLGAGSGAFTLALGELLGAAGQIIAIDRDSKALIANQRAMQQHFPAVNLATRTADFTQPLTLPLLDGIVMANALHFHRDKLPILSQLRGYLRPGGHLIVVEYNVDHGNWWVPYPFSYPTWEKLADQTGLIETRLLAVHPSRFLKEIYAAVASVRL